MAEAAGIHLESEPLVFVGSMCRRTGNDLKMVPPFVEELAQQGLRLHLLGFEPLTLQRCVASAVQSDSLAWSDTARKEAFHLPGCEHGSRGYRGREGWGNCANCPRWAWEWYLSQLRALPEEMLARCPWRGAEQLQLFG